MNGFRVVKQKQLLEMGFDNTRKEGQMVVITNNQPPQTQIEVELGMTEENLVSDMAMIPRRLNRFDRAENALFFIEQDKKATPENLIYAMGIDDYGLRNEISQKIESNANYLDEIDPMEIKASEWAALTPTQRTAMTDYASHLKRVKEVEAKELKLKKDRREVVDAKIVQAEFDRRTAELIQGLSRCGTALSVQLEGRDQREIKRIIDRYINNLRDTYSRTLPKNIKSLDDVENEE